MERGSSKVGPRTDDALKHDTEGLVRSGHATHAEEWKGSEPSGEDQPLATLNPSPETEDAPPGGLSHAERELRAELASGLGRAPYPITRDEVLAILGEHNATDRVMDLAGQLPADRSFENLQHIWVALGGHTEERTN